VAQRGDDDGIVGSLRGGRAARGEQSNEEKTAPAFHVRTIV
jgi:hypothetical protein